jgi:sorbitol-6-phosphate 2-dehydrogenase
MVRGALLRFVPAVTVTTGPAGEGQRPPAERSGSAGATGSGEPFTLAGNPESLGAPELVAALEAYVQTNGTIPRHIRIQGGPQLVTGSTLARPSERANESLLTADECAGRAGVVHGRVAVVTGGAQGFGEQLVRELVANGARVVIVDLNSEGAETLSRAINEEAGPVTRAVGADVSDEASVREMVSQVVRLAGGIDLFVSNAGVLKAGSVKEISAADFEFVTRVNYTGFFLCSKHAGLAMEAQNEAAPPDRHTDIVQINSKSGLAGSNKNGAYAGSKFGGIGLVQSFALELVEDRIKVNAICPGNFFEGPLWSDPDRGLFVQYLNAGKVSGAKSIADVKAHYEARVPMGRGCRGEDVARALFYIVEQRYETGQAIPVTGGQIMLS